MPRRAPDLLSRSGRNSVIPIMLLPLQRRTARGVGVIPWHRLAFAPSWQASPWPLPRLSLPDSHLGLSSSLMNSQGPPSALATPDTREPAFLLEGWKRAVRSRPAGPPSPAQPGGCLREA